MPRKSERDELRGTLSNTICNAMLYPPRAVPHLLGGNMSEVLDRTADAVLAAGFRKPKQVTTAEELDALPVGSIVAMIGSEPESPAVACRAVRGWQFLGDDPERRYLSSSIMPTTEPVSVLYEPDPQP